MIFFYIFENWDNWILNAQFCIVSISNLIAVVSRRNGFLWTAPYSKQKC